MKTKTKSEIEKELVKLRQRITELVASDNKRTSVRPEPKDRNVEQELREARSYLENILNTVPVHIASTDLNGKYTSWNRASEDMFGFTAEEVIGKLTPRRFHRNDEEAKSVINMAEREGKFDDDVILVRRDGSEFPAHLLVTKTVDSKGNQIGYTGVAVDVTERVSAEQAEKRAKKELGSLYVESQEARKSLLSILADVSEKEKALRESEERFQDVVENTGDWIWEVDKEGHYTYSSPVVRQIVGYEDKEVLGKHFYDFFHPDERDELKKAAFKVFKQKESFKNFINRNVHKDGQVVILETSGVPLLDDSGNLLGYRGVDRDITERKQAEEALRESQRYTRGLIESSVDSLVVISAEGKITDGNRASELITGISSKELIGTDFSIYFTDPDMAQNGYQQVFRDGYVRDYPLEIKHRAGRVTPVLYNASVYKNAQGNVAGVFAAARDITERVSQEKERRHLEEQLRQSQKMESIGNLAGGIAHDFNNLLTIISGYSQLMLDRLDKNTPLRKNVEKIIKAGSQAASLTRQLLAFSRKQVLEPKVLNLNETIVNEQKLLLRLIGEDIKLEADLAPNLKPVKVDPGQIEQVIMNLVVNARDAMPDGGKITIRTENVDIDKELSKVIPEALPGRFVRFSVEDAGVGIDKAIIDQIFEPFFTTKETGVGTGLGLSVVYGIIKQHDGWINVYSEPGHGSTFKVYLPAVSAEIEDEKKDAVSFKELKGNGERILLVEDEEGIRGFAAEALRLNGYIIFEAANAKEALYLFKNEDGNFNLVFSDVVMPGKSGLQLVVELLSDKPDLRVLLSSGYSDKKSRWREIKKRGFRFLQKPYNVAVLLETIREVLEQR